MYKSDQEPFPIEVITAALLDDGAPFPPAMVHFFSDLSSADLAQVSEVWPDVVVERRRSLLEDMETLSEGDVLLYFDPLAIMCLDDADPAARAAAVRLLWQSRQESLVPKFIKLLEEDPEAIVRAAAATALGKYTYLGELDEIKDSTYKDVLESLIKAHLDAKDTLVQRRALESLGYAGHPEVPGFIQRAYETNDEEWLQSALCAMGRSYDRKWVKQILEMLDHPDIYVRYEAIRASGELEAQAAREPLFDLLEEGLEDEDLYFAAIWALSKIGGEGVRTTIENAIVQAEDFDEIQFMEEALENLNFTEQVIQFDLMGFDEDDPDSWFDEDDY